MNKKKEKESISSFCFSKEMVGAGIFCLSILFILSLLGFSAGLSHEKWVGLAGLSIGWFFHITFGILSYPIAFIGAATGLHLFLSKEIAYPKLKLLYSALFLTSLSIFLSLMEVRYPSVGKNINTLIYPHAKTPYHIGGSPFFYLYHDLPLFNFKTWLGDLGVMIVCTTTLLAPLLLFIKKESKTSIVPKIKPPLGEKEPFIPVKKKEIERFVIPSLVKPKPLTLPKVVNDGTFQLPSADLLSNPKPVDQSELKDQLRKQAQILEETLSNFGIEAKVGQINCGPTINSFEVHPSVGVKVQKIKALEHDIALNMEASSIRIIAPIPGKAAVGIEIPNPKPEEVSFKEMLSAYHQSGKNFKIPILLGKSVSGEYVMSDLSKMPHCIIAGATGSGKSVCINTVVMSILYNAKPDEVRLLMVDPKKVELTQYTNLPHMIAPVITDPQSAYRALKWMVAEMEKRYEILKQVGVRNIDAFNKRKIDKTVEDSLSIPIPEKLPYLVGIVDELADLMMIANCDIETPIARIAQMARAVGIHLILATQRPSREVITGLIKANFPTRISFKVSSRINSQIILDETGAESLLGNGDMLFLPPGTSHLIRAQGAFIRDEDIHAVIQDITSKAPAKYDIASFDNLPDFDSSGQATSDNSQDTLYQEAYQIVTSTGNASTTFLQRKLKIGYARAASLMDALEMAGIVSAQEGSRARRVNTFEGDE